MEDYYQILNVEKNATQKDIRVAYTTLSLKYHPDKNKSAGAEEKFKKISTAYHVLADNTTREIYDNYGEDGLKIRMQNANNANHAATSHSNTATAESSDMTTPLLIFAGLAGLGLFVCHMATRKSNNH